MHAMKSLFLAWQDSGPSRAWFPIGRLDAETSQSRYSFGYTRGATRAAAQAGLQPLLAFPDFDETYESSELFPLFRNRVLGSDRADFLDYLKQLDLKPEEANPIAILAVTGGTRQTDNLEVFPKLERRADGTFCCRFFLHGTRHVHKVAYERIEGLQTNEPLRVSVELNNPATSLALQVQSGDYVMLGWAPRYLVKDLTDAIAESPAKIAVQVVKVNPAPAPTNQRVLVELKGFLPNHRELMSGPDFQLLHPAEIPWGQVAEMGIGDGSKAPA
jgi:hypothetical protein